MSLLMPNAKGLSCGWMGVLYEPRNAYWPVLAIGQPPEDVCTVTSTLSSGIGADNFRFGSELAVCSLRLE
jgi:hypothetical protein